LFASPWVGAHDIFAGAASDALTERGRAALPAIMGELLWDLWPGPVDRWDEGNYVQVRLYGGALASVTRDALLGGDNAFAVEGANGEWEILQAASAILVAPNQYELRDFLRARQGSAHAMRAPHPAGARIVKLDRRLARVSIASHEWGELLHFAAPPPGALANDSRAAGLVQALPRAAERPWAPAHVRAKRNEAGDIEISWIRCARLGGDHWGPGEPPLGAAVEGYSLEILDGEDLRRALSLSAPEYVYSGAEQTADFGAPPSLLRLLLAQLDDAGVPGLKTDLTFTL
jgi:hypothetical protein